MTRTDTPSKPSDHPPDPRAQYHTAISRWEMSARDHHRAGVAVACGTGTAAELHYARDIERYDLARAISARGDAAGVLVDLVRLAIEDEYAGYSLRLHLLGLLRPALESMADRLRELEQRVADLEAVVAAGGVA